MNRPQLAAMLEKASLGILLGISILIPLAFNPWGFETTDNAKNIVLYLGTGLGLILLGLNVFTKKEFIAPKGAVWASIWLLALCLFGLLVSDRPGISFWGSFYRHGGVLNLCVYLMLFWVGLNILKKKEHLNLWMHTVQWGGFLVALYAIAQKIGIDVTTTSLQDAFENRSFSSLGIPTALGEFLIFPISITLYEVKTHPKNGRQWLLLCTLMLALLFSENRASILGLGIVGLLDLIRGNSLKKWLKLSLITVLALSLFSLPLLRGTRSIESRIELWEMGANNIIENKGLGAGPENFTLDSETLISKHFLELEGYDAVPDRIHNEWLAWFNDYGFLGAFTYLLFFAYVLRRWWKEAEAQQGFLLFGVLALGISYFFSFSLVSTASFLVLFTAASMTKISPSQSSKKPRSLILFCSTSLGLLLVGLGLHFTTILLGVDKINYDLATQNLAEARQELDSLKDKWIPYPEVYNFMSEAYWLLGANEQAAWAVQKSRVKNHDQLASLLLDAAIQESLSDLKRANAVYELGYNKKTQSPLLFAAWAEFAFRNQDWEQAAWAYQELFQTMPDSSHWNRIFWKNHPEFISILKHKKVTDLQSRISVRDFR